MFHAEAEGSAKNANGLMRQYFPANRFLAFLSASLNRIALRLNQARGRPWAGCCTDL